MSYFNNIQLIKFGQVPDVQQLSGRQTLLRYEIYFRSTRPIYGHLQGGLAGLRVKVKQKF